MYDFITSIIINLISRCIQSLKTKNYYEYNKAVSFVSIRYSIVFCYGTTQCYCYETSFTILFTSTSRQLSGSKVQRVTRALRNTNFRLQEDSSLKLRSSSTQSSPPGQCRVISDIRPKVDGLQQNTYCNISWGFIHIF